MSIQEEIRGFIVDKFLLGKESGLNDDTSFLKDGIVDSLGIMQLVSFVQEQYLIAIEDEDLTPQNLDSIERVSQFIQGKKRLIASGGGIS